MADNRKYVQGQDYTLAGSGIIAGALSVTLSSFTTPDGTLITMTDFGTLGNITFEPETGNEENASFTGVTQNVDGTATLTGLTKGLGFVDPYTAVSALDVAHAGGTIARVSNSAPFLKDFANKENDETISQTWTYTNTNIPRLDSFLSPTLDAEFAPKKYVDDIAIAGAPNASDITKGITKLSVAAASPTDPIAVGDNDTRVPTQDENNALAGNAGTPSSTNTYVTQQGFQEATEVFAASSAGSDAYVIALTPAITSYTDGQIFRFEADVQNTGAATLNAGGGAKAIEKGASTVLQTGDIAANSTVTVVFNSTNDNFQLQTPSAGNPIPETIVDAKGDLIAATANDAVSRLPVGTNQFGLRADSGEATGLLWTKMMDAGVETPASNSDTGDATVDTTVTTSFLPNMIEISYKISGNTSGVPKHSLGTATFVGTTLENVDQLLGNQNAATSVTESTILIANTTITQAGSDPDSSSVGVTFTVFSVSATNFVIRTTYNRSAGGSTTGTVRYGFKAWA